MTDEQINAAIAEARDWKPARRSWKISKGENGRIIDYFSTKEAAENYLKVGGHEVGGWLDGFGVFEVTPKPPNYCNELHLMHEVEQTLDIEQRELFADMMYSVCVEGVVTQPNRLGWRFALINANPRQRAEAFLKTIKKWKHE